MTELEQKVERLEKEVAELKESVEYLKSAMLMKVCSNSVLKEEYNFRILKYLCDKLSLELPEQENDFGKSLLSHATEVNMEFTYRELMQPEQMIGIALTSGKVGYNEISESIHKKVTRALYKSTR